MKEGFSSRRRICGFSMLESLVALALLAAVAGAVFSAALRASEVQEAARRASEAAALEEFALELLRTKNISAEQQGDLVLGGVRVVWQSQPSGEPRDGTNWPRGPGLFRFQRYTVLVDATNQNANARFKVQMTGWVKVREDPRIQL
jgi:general secretion pathway protein I